MNEKKEVYKSFRANARSAHNYPPIHFLTSLNK